MHHQPNPGDAPGDVESAIDAALLGLLVHDHPGLWGLGEFDRSLVSSGQTTGGGEPSRRHTEDAIERLYAAGLIHRIGQFVFASSAARAAQALAA
jgi:hypothetical protein